MGRIATSANLRVWKYVPSDLPADECWPWAGAVTVIGFSEYARSMHYTPEPAQQALFLVSPEHSVTASMAALVADRKAEGW